MYVAFVLKATLKHKICVQVEHDRLIRLNIVTSEDAIEIRECFESGFFTLTRTHRVRGDWVKYVPFYFYPTVPK